jgi:hypothetical protein
LTHLYLFEWCEVDVTSLSIFVIYQAHLPEPRTCFSPIPQSDKLAVAYRSSIFIYGHSGLLGSISLESAFSSVISALAFVIPRVEQSSRQRASLSFILSTVDNGVYFVQLIDQDASMGLLSIGKLREHCHREFVGSCNQSWPQAIGSSKYSPIIPFYTQLLPVLQITISSDDHWSMLVFGSHHSIGSQLLVLQMEQDRNHEKTSHSLFDLPRVASLTGHFDHFSNLTHIVPTHRQHSRGKDSIDSFYGCCSPPDTIDHSDRSILFRFHLDLTILSHISCPLDLPTSRSTFQIHTISKGAQNLIFLTSRQIGETTILSLTHPPPPGSATHPHRPAPRSNELELYSPAGDLVLDEHSLLIQQLNENYFLQCTEHSFQILEVNSLRRISQPSVSSSSTFHAISDCCRVHSSPTIDSHPESSYFVISGDGQTLILFALVGDQVRELIRQRFTSTLSSLSSVAFSAHPTSHPAVFLSFTEANHTHHAEGLLVTETKSDDWRAVCSVKFLYPPSEIPFVAHHLCSNLDLETGAVYVLCGCLDGRMLIFQILLDSASPPEKNGTLVDSFIESNAGGIRSILRGPVIDHWNKRDRKVETKPSFIVNSENEASLYYLAEEDRWVKRSICVPLPCKYLTPISWKFPSLQQPTTQHDCNFPPMSFSWLDISDADGSVSLEIGTLSPPIRERIVPDLFFGIQGSVIELISIRTEGDQGLVLISWQVVLPETQVPSFGSSLYDFNLKRIWTERFREVPAISQCPVPPGATSIRDLLTSFLVVEGPSKVHCYGFSRCPKNESGVCTEKYSVRHLMTFSLQFHDLHLSPKLLGADHLIYCSESAMVVLAWKTDTTLLDSAGHLLPRTATMSLVASQPISNQVKFIDSGLLSSLQSRRTLRHQSISPVTIA